MEQPQARDEPGHHIYSGADTPMRSSLRNCPKRIFMLPARGGAIVLTPGMNFAIRSVVLPRL